MNLIFDLFGTLVNRSLNSTSVGRLGEILGQNYLDIYRHHELACDMGRMEQYEFWATVHHELNIEPIRKSKELDDLILSTVAWRSSRIENELQAMWSRRWKLYLATNTRREWFETLEKKFRLHSLFHGIYASFELGCRKPSGLFFIKILADINQPAETILFVDDEPANLKAAQAFGLRTMLADEFWGNA